METDMLPTIRHSLTDNVKDELMRYIRRMDLSESTKLPSELTIAQNLGVSRITVCRVLGDLEQENVIFRIHGKGTFVNPEALQIKISLNPAQEFHQLIECSGHRPQVKMVRMEQDLICPGIAKKLALAPDAPLLRTEKVYYADEEPAILCFNYFSRAVFAEIPSWEEFENTSAFFLLRERAGRVMMRDRIEMEAKEISELLPLTDQVKHFNCKALLQFDTINYDQNNQPAMYGLCYYNTNFIRFNLLRNQNIY